MIVRIDTRRIVDWDSFHDVFKEAFGFPEFYGRNLNAWIDCLSYLDDSDAGMTGIHVRPGETVTLQLEDVMYFRQRCKELYDAIIECSAFVNWRRIEAGEPPVLLLAFHS